MGQGPVNCRTGMRAAQRRHTRSASRRRSVAGEARCSADRGGRVRARLRACVRVGSKMTVSLRVGCVRREGGGVLF
jgi:hypothetical protein